jgi:hypothetical protein
MLETDPTAQVTERGERFEGQEELAHAAEELSQAAMAVQTMTAPGLGNGASVTESEAAAAVATALAPLVEEPTETGDIDVATLGDLGLTPIPAIPFPLLKRRVYGRYRSSGALFQVELRVDIDGPKATMRVSADYYSVAGATISYFGSMRVDAPSIAVSPTQVVVTGLGNYTWAAGAPQVKITIPRVPILSPPAAARLQHLTTSGAPGATYFCAYASPYYRSVLFEQDRQDTVPAPFVSYNTGSLPSGGPARALSVVGAYAEAGLQLQTSGISDVVNTSETGANGSWSDAELHAAMVKHFSLWKDLPQWAVWLFHAQIHDIGPNLYGIMFDQIGRQRQGAAVFYAGIGGATADKQRLQLYTCTHELGHCFNLLHSWQKSLAIPPAPNRPNALSWLNYPWYYPTGGPGAPGSPGAFWSAFPFQFDNQELIHLRHAFRDSVIMGGNPFRVGSALEDPDGWRDPERDDSGLRLELRAPSSFAYGAPVSVDVVLSTMDPRGKRVGRRLRPRNGTVEIAVGKPNDRVVVYRPLLHHCSGPDDVVILDAENPSVSDTAFIHYGQDGFTFDQPGTYRLRARYYALDGSIVLSDVMTIRIQAPATGEDSAIADLLFGDEQGTLMYLMGSDLDELQAGNDAFEEIVKRHPKHPLADVARLVLGVNAAREFKHVEPDSSVRVRKPDTKKADSLLKPIIDVTAVRRAAAGKQGEPVEMRRAAAAHIRDVTEEKPTAASAFVRSRRREIAVELATEVS